jgi:2-keto-4-pentenoate hydratase/2-oxohepta-3-ene-1,7-dioic acid hydratase in catechol pathway
MDKMAFGVKIQKQGLTIIPTSEWNTQFFMVQRYVRVQVLSTQANEQADNPSNLGQIEYGLLQADHSVTLLDTAPWLGGVPTPKTLQPKEYQLLAPCLPSKIIAIGKNYALHAAEMGGEVPKEPLLFLKPPSAVIADGEAIWYPPQSEQVDYEGELALVIGERCFNCSPTESLTKIWGYTIANDVTARDLQRKDNQWARAKGCDSFCPLGPWIVRELSPVAQLQTFLNQDPTPVQSASIAEMTYAPAALVSYISQAITLLPGDIVLTGTPSGVGPLNLGDQVRVEIEGIGCLQNSVIARPT